MDFILHSRQIRTLIYYLLLVKDEIVVYTHMIELENIRSALWWLFFIIRPWDLFVFGTITNNCIG